MVDLIALIFVIAVIAVIVVVGTAAFVLIVINIQIVDRSKRLMQEPRTILDAATRRVLGTCRHSPVLRQTKGS